MKWKKFTHIWWRFLYQLGPGGSWKGLPAAWRLCCSDMRCPLSAGTSRLVQPTAPDTQTQHQCYPLIQSRNKAQSEAAMTILTHQLYSVVINELLSCYTVDLVHKSLLVREEVVEFVREAAAQGNAALVALVQTLHHWNSETRYVIR